jgi:hypothetical protein
VEIKLNGFLPKKKKWMWIAVGILVVLVVYLLIATSDGQDDLDDAEKVAVQFWTASLFHNDKQTQDRLISSKSTIDTGVKLLHPTKPGKVWITSFPEGSDERQVYMYISPELDEDGALLQQLTLVMENGQWKVLDAKGIETHTHNPLPFEAFQGTPQYKAMFGNAEWKEVTIH